MRKIALLLVALMSATIIDGFTQDPIIYPEPGYNTVCPGDDLTYSLDPDSFTDCGQVTWTVSKGTFVFGQTVTTIVKESVTDGVHVWWNDVTGTGTLSVYSTCEEGGLSVTNNYTIRSLNSQDPANAIANITLQYCSTSSINLQVDQMLVPNTGFGTTILQQYADGYRWDIPPGWKSGGQSGPTFYTQGPFLTITPDDGCKQGTVTVKAYVECSSGKKYSNGATISVNKPTPNLTITPQAGYNGPSCGNQSAVTFTVTPISCAATYRWVFSGLNSNTPTGWLESTPSGWEPISSPVITTTNYITVKPSGGEADAGSILATAILSCNSQIPSQNYSLVYQEPVINGPSTICGSGTFTIGNATGVSPTWSSSNTGILTINPSTGQASQVSSNVGRVKVSVTFACGGITTAIEKTIWVGKPEIEMISFSNSVDEGWYFCSSASGNTFVLDTKTPSANFQARMLNWPSLTVAYTSPINYYDSGAYEWNYVPIPNNGYYVFEMKGSNVCGPTDWIGFEVEYIDCSGFGEGLFSVYPNPVESSLTIERVQQNDGKELSYENVKLQPKSILIELFDKDGKLVLSKLGDESLLPFQANTSYLQNGFYALALTINGRKVFRRIRVAH